jgi:hypothetical protein
MFVSEVKWLFRITENQLSRSRGDPELEGTEKVAGIRSTIVGYRSKLS